MFLLVLRICRFFSQRHRMLSLIPPELKHTACKHLIQPNNRLSLWFFRTFRNAATAPAPHVRLTRRTVKSSGADITVFQYTPKSTSRAIPGTPVVLWIHGGGYIMGSAAMDHEYCSYLAQDLQCQIFSVDYRLAPEHPYPIPLDDCYAAVEWLCSQNPSSIVVVGSSAGGGLAAALVQRAVDNKITIAFQALIYPMLDDATGHTDTTTTFAPLWWPSANRYGWRSYLGGNGKTTEPGRYAVPARRDDLSGTPPAWIGVGTLDLFYAENVAYAMRLPECELVTVPGMYHGTDILVPNDERMVAFRDSLLTAIRKHLA